MLELLSQLLGIAHDETHSVAPTSNEMLGRIPDMIRTTIVDQVRQATPVLGDLARDMDAASKAVRGLFQDGEIDLQARHQLTASPR